MGDKIKEAWERIRCFFSLARTCRARAGQWLALAPKHEMSSMTSTVREASNGLTDVVVSFEAQLKSAIRELDEKTDSLRDYVKTTPRWYEAATVLRKYASKAFPSPTENRSS